MNINQIPIRSELKRKAPTGEPRPRGQPRKVTAAAPVLAILDIFFVIMDLKSLEPFIVLADLREIASAAKESADKSAITAEKIIFATKENSKVHEPSLYEEVVLVPTYSR